MKKRIKLSAILILVFTVALSAAAIWIGFRLSQESNVDPDDSKAASEQVTNADKLKTQEQRDAFNLRWKNFIADTSNTWEDYLDYALSEEGSRYDCDTVIMDKVGDETLYGCDLNAVFVASGEMATYISSEAIGPQNSTLNKVLDELITESGLLQKAAELDHIQLDNTIFNSASKDMAKRFDAVSAARDFIGGSFVKRVDLETVTIYFHNEQPPEGISLENAKTAAKAKMDNLYARIKSGEITMKQAGDEIKADKIKGDTTGVSLSKLDSLYVENAYSSIIGHEFGEPIFIDPVYDEELRSLGEGQISTVRLFKDYAFTAEELDGLSDLSEIPTVESSYVIFKVNKIYFDVKGDLNSESMTDITDKITDQYKENAEIKLE